MWLRHLTWGYVVVWFYLYLLPHFDIVNSLEYGESMTDTEDVHFFQLLMLKSYQCFPHNLVLCFSPVS